MTLARNSGSGKVRLWKMQPADTKFSHLQAGNCLPNTGNGNS